MATFSKSVPFTAGGFNLSSSYYSASTGYTYSGGNQSETISATLSFSSIPTNATINSVSISWGSISLGSHFNSYNSRSNTPSTNDSLLSTLQKGTRSVTFKVGANLKWNAFTNTTSTTWMQWSIGTTTVTVDYSEAASVTAGSAALNVGATQTASINGWHSGIDHAILRWQIYQDSTWTTLSSATLTSATAQSTTIYSLSNATVKAVMASQVTASCRVTLISYSDDTTTLGSASIATFNLNIPDTSAYYPTINSVTIAPSLKTGLSWKDESNTAFYTDYTYIKVTVNATTSTGSSINAITISCSDLGETGTLTASGTWTSSKTFSSSGDKIFTIKATDARGRSSSTTTQTITVKAPVELKLTSHESTRAETSDDSTYYASSTGTKVLTSYVINYPNKSSSDGMLFSGNSIQTLTLIIYKGDYDTKFSTTTSFNSKSSSGTKILLSDTFDEDTTYYLTLTIADRGKTLAKQDLGTINKVHCNMHLAGSGYGVGIGAFVEDATASAPVFRSAYPAELNGGLRIANPTSSNANNTADIKFRLVTQAQIDAGVKKTVKGYITFIVE